MNMNKIYTGIGSRSCPDDILGRMSQIAAVLASKGYTLRSGGADGADLAFEIGCDSVKGNKEIYLPWKNFNNNKSNLYKISPEAYKLAESIHPAWSRLSLGAKKLHARNIYQCLGHTLDTPSDFLICWTSKGEKIGGTRTAIILAEQKGIPVYNLGLSCDIDSVLSLL